RSRRSTLQMRSKRGYGLMLEHAPDLEAVASLIEARRDLDAENGIAAQVEEVVVDPDPFDPQHLLPDLRHRPLLFIPRPFVPRPPPAPGRPLRPLSPSPVAAASPKFKTPPVTKLPAAPRPKNPPTPPPPPPPATYATSCASPPSLRRTTTAACRTSSCSSNAA